MLRVLCLLASLTASSEGATFDATLTPSGVASFNISNPLLVNISDVIRFTCNGSISNIYILASQQQWQACDATTGSTPFLWTYCTSNTSTKTVTIIHQSNTVAGTFSFDEGQVYYLASFSDGTLVGAVNSAWSGRECSSGVKMVIRVQSFTSPSPTSTSTSTSSTMQYTNGMPPSTNTPTTTSSGTGSQGNDTPILPSNGTLSDQVNTGLITIVVPAVSVIMGVSLIGVGIILLVVLVVVIRRPKISDLKGDQLNMGQDPTGSLRSCSGRQEPSDKAPLTCKENTSLTSETCKEMTSLTSNTILLEGVASQ